MKSIFLSASVPDPKRHERYHGTADNVAIRDAVRAIATVVLPSASLHWGGHPAITPLIRVVAESIGVTGADRVKLFQSEWFVKVLPRDNAAFETYVLTEKRPTLAESIALMREQMLGSAQFDAAVFIGGMEGVEDEFNLFRERFPAAPVFPVATTGAAAGIVYDRHRQELNLPEELAEDYAYPTLFRRLLNLP
jgi:hypothetical protein